MDINAQELKEKLDKKESFIFIDVREPYEYEQFNLNADLIPLGNIADAVLKYGDRKNEEVVVHCRSGARSAVARDFLIQQGFSNVRNLTGGIIAWKDVVK